MRPPMRSAPFSQRAFSLIELLITVSIMLLLLVFGMVNYLRSLDKQRVYQAGSGIEALLKDARSKAQNGFLGSDSLGYCAQLVGVEVFSSIDAGETQVDARLRCLDASTILYDTYVLEETDMVFDAHFLVLFKPMRGADVRIASTPVSSGSATLSNQGGDVVFSLDQGGSINVSYQ